MRGQVRAAVKGDIAPVGKNGGDRKSVLVTKTDPAPDTSERPYDQSADGILRRLKRDHPNLAQEVINGDTTATAAASRRSSISWQFSDFPQPRRLY